MYQAERSSEETSSTRSEEEVFSRMNKLESDLQLITTIRDIIVANNSNDLRCQDEHNEIPVRDNVVGENNKRKSSSKITTLQRINTLGGKSSNQNQRNKLCERKSSEIETATAIHEFGEVENAEKEKLNIGDGQEQLSTKLEMEEEKRRRKDVEESAKILVIKLQKTQDELERVNDTKKHLLVGTLELKNQMQSYDSQITLLNSKIQTIQTEKEGLSKELDKLKGDNASLVKESKDQRELLTKELERIQKRQRELQEESEFFQKKSENFKIELIRKEECLVKLDQRKTKEIEQVSTKLNTLEKERDHLNVEFELLQTKFDKLKAESELKQTHFFKTEDSLLFQIVEKDKKISKLEQVSVQEKERLQSQISSALGLISRTKSFILNLQQNKSAIQKELSIVQRKFKKVFKDREKFEKNERKLRQEIIQLRDKLIKIDSSYFDQQKNWEREKNNLKQKLEQVFKERDEFKNKLKNLQTFVDHQRNKSEEEKEKQIKEVNNLKAEIQKVSENFQILQKISEDQGRTISKQRSDLESSQESKYTLDLQIRECLQTEKVLHSRLKEEENLNESLEQHVSQLEQKIQRYQEELKSHDCEDSLDSKWKSRFDEIQTILEDKSLKWERRLKAMEKEKDGALSAARQALKQAQEMKESCDNRIIKMKSQGSQETSKIEQEKYQIENGMSKKIHELESELVKMKQMSGQMQRSYCTKIQQLQTALSLCIGGGGGNSAQAFGGFPTTFEPPGFMGFQFPNGMNLGNQFI